ncbi:MAG: hypothetical protein OXH00_23655, partial [Candidatus Poribacteria bacterium]|nr:hypothetical protein [Candidatus Poribacteria bacterium]
MAQNQSVIIKIEAGSVKRQNDLVRLPFKPKCYFPDWQEGTSGLEMAIIEADGHISDEEVPCQFEPTLRELAWQTGELPAGISAHYAIRQINKLPPIARYHIEQKPAHLLISAGDSLFARYNFLGVWKPYFWPL